MKKLLFGSAIIVSVILSPVIGMGIGETRNLLLNLAPDESILILADEIDKSRVENETKLAENETKLVEFQSVVDDQQAKLIEQQQTIDEQTALLEKTNSAISATNVRVSNEEECRKLYSENPECASSNKRYRTKKNFDESIRTDKKHGADNDDINRYKRTFELCQSIIEKCD